MNDLILSSNTNEPTMSSRMIADLTGKRHDHVLRDIRAMFEQLEVSPNFGEKVEATGGRPSSVYHLNRDYTDCLLTGYSAKARMQVIKRWRELESHSFDLPDFTNPAIAARAWADEVEQKQAALLQLESAKPAVEFVERYVSADSGSKGFRQVAKLLNANERELRQFLSDEKIMYRLAGEWMPYGNHIEAGRFEVKTGVADNEHAFNVAKFSAKGINWIAGKWAIHCIQEAA